MSKKNLLFLSLFLLFFISLKYSFLREKILFITDVIKKEYILFIDFFENIYQKHFHQKEKIEFLLKKNRELKKYFLVYSALQDEFNTLKKSCNINFSYKFNFKFVRAISYTKLNDFSSLWLEFEDFNESKIYGLVKDNYAAGIVVAQDHRAKALLNTNQKCSYGVEIGKSKAPGVAIGSKDGFLKVEFIPLYKRVKIGDEVVTSGMDKIFIYGIKVGKVVKVDNIGSFKVALVKPYANLSHPKYFWVILNED